MIIGTSKLFVVSIAADSLNRANNNKFITQILANRALCADFFKMEFHLSEV